MTEKGLRALPYKSAKFWLCIGLILCLISMVGTSAVESSAGRVSVTDHNVTMTELSTEIKSNNEAYGKNIEIHFSNNTAKNLHFKLLVPKTATADNPAPAIVCAHGASNTLEYQMPFYVEMARRGFVVASIDIEACGGSDNGLSDLSAGSLGMLPTVEWLMSQAYVDEQKIAVTGHSYGNSGCLKTIAALNVEGSTQRIRGWVDGDGLRYLPNLTAENAQGLIMTVGAAKYGESTWPLGYDYLNSDNAKGLVSVFDSTFSGGTVSNGQWYAASGPIAAPASGEALSADSALCIRQYNGTHPMWYFSREGASIAIDGFYAALGTPSGVAPIDSGSQVWKIAVVFELLGLIGFFLLMCPLVSLLLKVPFFQKGIVRPLPAQEELPSFRDPRRWGVALLAMASSAVFTYFNYIKLYPLAMSAVSSASFPDACANTKALVLWNLASGLFMLALIMAVYFIHRLVYRKENVQLPSPFASAELDSVKQFLKIALFAGIIVALMYIPVTIAHVVFQADFRICNLVVPAGDITWLYVILTRYLPMWLIFFVPSAVLNANMRFQDLPDWLGATIMALANAIPLIIVLFVQYSAVLKGQPMPYNSAACILAFSIIPINALATFTTRYIYKKTGNAWAAGMVNGTLLCLMLVYSGAWGIDAFIF